VSTKKNPQKNKNKKIQQMGSSLGPGDYIKGIIVGLVILAICGFIIGVFVYKYVRPATKGIAKTARKIARSSLMAAS
jgi:hypothetical protein